MRRLVLVLVALAGLVTGYSMPAHGAVRPVTDAPNFLARYGLDAQQVPVVGVDSVDGTYLSGAQGGSFSDRIEIADRVLDGQDRVNLAHVALHEYLHEASMYRHNDEFWELAPEDDGDALVAYEQLYEEGPVEAVAIDLLPNWWRYITGKRLRYRAKVGPGAYVTWTPIAQVPDAYLGVTQFWRVCSARQTGQRMISPAAASWRRWLLSQGYAQRIRIAAECGT